MLKLLIGKLEHVGYYGLNWKSLSQPAILPSSTDFLLPLSDLQDGDKFELQANYSLIMDPTVCPFETPENLLTEMICQRLAQEYQLVEGVDIIPYRNYIMTIAGLSLVNPSLNNRGFSSSKNLFTSSLVPSSTTEGKDKDKELFFVLSMGHRIQFLVYDPIQHRVNVTRLLAKHGSYKATTKNDLTVSYAYESWVPQLECYATMEQKFSQFPVLEYAWNPADEILLCNQPIDTSSHNVRAKRLRFAVIPDIMTNSYSSTTREEEIVSTCIYLVIVFMIGSRSRCVRIICFDGKLCKD